MVVIGDKIIRSVRERGGTINKESREEGGRGWLRSPLRETEREMETFSNSTPSRAKGGGGREDEMRCVDKQCLSLLASSTHSLYMSSFERCLFLLLPFWTCSGVQTPRRTEFTQHALVELSTRCHNKIPTPPLRRSPTTTAAVG